MKLPDLLIAGAVLGDEGWQTEWPAEPNSIWWFFGWPHGKAHSEQPELCLVELWLTGNQRIAYVKGGSFLYKAEGAIGKWKRVDLPNLPVSGLEVHNAQQA